MAGFVLSKANFCISPLFLTTTKSPPISLVFAWLIISIIIRGVCLFASGITSIFPSTCVCALSRLVCDWQSSVNYEGYVSKPYRGRSSTGTIGTGGRDHAVQDKKLLHVTRSVVSDTPSHLRQDERGPPTTCKTSLSIQGKALSLWLFPLLRNTHT